MVKTEKFILRYANCWEDADLLIQNLNCKKGDRILSICSGGENSLSLLCLNPEEIVVVDVNPKQLFILELKMAAIRQLDHDECLLFLGYKTCKNRLITYQKLILDLSVDAKIFWNSRLSKIKQGIIFDGRVERNLKAFAKYYRPLIHSNKKVNELMLKKSSDEQKQFFEKYWNTKKWRLMFRIFFSNTLLKLTAPDPDFFSYVNVNVGEYLLHKTANHFSDKICQENHILHYALNGNFGNILPHFMQKDNFYTIKNNLHKISLHCGFFQDVFKDGKLFNGFNLSNIFEYTTADEFKTLAHDLYAASAPNAKIIYWNILLPRKISDIHNLEFENVLDTSINQNIKDKGWVYYRCLIDKVKK